MNAIRILLLLCLVSLSAACSRGGKESPSLPLTALLPQSTAAFYAWGPLGEIAKKPIAATLSPFERIEDLQGTVSVAGVDNKELFAAIVSALNTSGVLDKEGNTNPSLELLFSWHPTEDLTKPHLSLFGRAAGEVDFRNIVEALARQFPSEGASVIATDNEKSVVLIHESLTFHVRASQTLFSVSSSPENSNLLFNNASTTRYQELASLPQFKSLFGSLANSGQRIAHGFIDVKAVKKLAGSITDREAKEALESLPIEAGALVQEYGTNMVTEAALQIVPQNDDQKLLVEKLSREPQSTVVSSIATRPTLVLQVDGRLIDTVFEGALSEMKDAADGDMGTLIDLLRRSTGLAIFIDQAKPENPFPDLAALIESSEAEKVTKLISDELHSLLLSQNMVGGWMEKTIGGKSVRYLMSPLGVGLFVTSSENKILLATSESGIAALLAAAPQGEKGLEARLRALSATLFTPKPLIVGYADMESAAKILEELQGTMALFTGGAAAVNAEQVQDLKRLGESALSIGVTDNMVIFRSSISAITAR